MQAHLLARIRLGCFHSAWIFLTVTLLLVGTGNSQTAGTGNIQGTISDPTGAVVQNSSVAVIDTATGVQHKTTTGADGLYSFPIFQSAFTTWMCRLRVSSTTLRLVLFLK
jgi:hypothetical protein